MEEDRFRECVELWQGAGSSPYEVLIEEGVYDYFLRVLEDSVYDISDNPISDTIYRGLSNLQEKLKVGDIIEFNFPHSWTEDQEMALNFAEVDGVVLILSPKTTLKGISIANHGDSFYNESEIILLSLKLKVVKIFQEDGHDYACVEIL